MKKSTGDFDLIMTDKHCDIVADDMAMLLPITMTLEECIEICCEQIGTQFIEFVRVTSEDSDGNCRGVYSYGY